MVGEEGVILVDGLDADGQGRGVEQGRDLLIEAGLELRSCSLDQLALAWGLRSWEDGA